jgi:two-component system sensor histidine kinase MprB
MQLVDADGGVVAAFDGRTMPVTDEVLAVANGERDETFFDARVDDTAVRVYAVSAGDGTALQVGRSLNEVNATLRRLVFTLTGISVAAIGVAALVGRLVAAAAATPVRRVAEAAESVARTGDLGHHIDVRGGEDLDRLATSFNTMLDALDDSLTRQRQLVADASHELRTPLATVRTNVEVLARVDELAPDERDALIRDTVAQTGELTRLVGDLVELARGDVREEPAMATNLHEVTIGAVESARRNYPAVTFELSGADTIVHGVPDRVARAVSNLLDNAAKWSPPGSTVEIAVGNGTVTVRDHGPGIDPADLQHIFDRFYRAASARTLPGSGLGLAIVKQVADSHGGIVTAEPASGGGTRFVLELPTAHDSD